MRKLPYRSVDSPREGDCRSCASCDRRDFVRTGLGIAGLAALAALVPAEVAATPLGTIRSRRTAGELRYPIPEAEGVAVDRDGEVILVRAGDVVTAFALSCPHQRSMLRWRENKGIFQCTKHHSEYDLSGAYQTGRATRNMDRLEIRRDGDEVVVDPSTAFHSDEDPQGWQAAKVEV